MAEAASASPYDAIAHLYDVDMARNMPFDDVSFYARLAEGAHGRVLELGCGNGRILLELLRRGVDAYGVDRSAAMLRELRRKAAAGNGQRLVRMDARALGFASAFALVLAPYSLVTYMVTKDDARRMLTSARRALARGGRLVIDAFVPQPGVESNDFRVDYRRLHQGRMLTRWRRILPLAPQVNRIERTYRLCATDGNRFDEIVTREEIRLFTPGDVRKLLGDAGFAIDSEWWDYAAKLRPIGARFFTACASIPTAI